MSYYKEEIEVFKNQLFNTLQLKGYKMKPTNKLLSVMFEDLNICVNIVNITFSKYIGENYFQVSFNMNVVNTFYNKVITSYAFNNISDRDVYAKIEKCLFEIQKENSEELRNTLKGFNKIAQKYFNREDLKVKNSDEIDFLNVSIWNIEKALKAAYDMGYKEGNKHLMIKL